MQISFEIPLWGPKDSVKTRGTMTIKFDAQGKILMEIEQSIEDGLDEMHFEIRPEDLRSIMHALRTCQIQADNEHREQPRGYRDPRFVMHDASI